MNLRLAIVGCGAIAEQMHIPTTLQTEGVELAALVDADMGRAEKLKRQFIIPVAVSDLSELQGRVDAVILATPPHVRVTLAEQAFGLGLHVLSEKPLANTIAECDAVVKAANESGCVLAVGHMYRFWPVRMEIKKMIEDLRYGRVRSVMATEGKVYKWPSATGYTVRREMVPGGVLINAGIHTLDALLWWLGDPEAVDYKDDAVGGLESNVELKMIFPQEVSVRFRQSRTCSLPYWIEIEFEKATVAFPTNSIYQYQVVANGVREEISCSDIRSHKQCWEAQLTDFVQSIGTGTAPSVSGNEGTRVVRLIQNCYEEKRSRPLPEHAPLPGFLW